jgi:hypothetical protein
MLEDVLAAGNVRLKKVTIDTDTTVHTLYGNQMGARKSYNPKNKGKKSYQPILSFIAETREFVFGELRACCPCFNLPISFFRSLIDSWASPIPHEPKNTSIETNLFSFQNPCIQSPLFLNHHSCKQHKSHRLKSLPFRYKEGSLLRLTVHKKIKVWFGNFLNDVFGIFIPVSLYSLIELDIHLDIRGVFVDKRLT